jgi:ADP-ribose pyrophosphatase YjhB (NUDIX family)
MKIKVFFGNKPVYICSDKDDEIKELMHHPDVIFMDELSKHAVNALLHEVKKDEFHAGIICHPEFAELKKLFFRHFTLIEAAGGIVQNDERQVLMIFRKGLWDLPKGKMEKGESPEDAAAREIEEETGVSGLQRIDKIGETYHCYDEFGKHILKTTHWFYFTCGNGHPLTPQSEEDITEAKWWDTKDIKEPTSKTYESIREILSIFFDRP